MGPAIPTKLWRRAQDLFCTAIELPSEERSQFLRQECSGEPELRQYLDMMVNCYVEAPDFLDHPARGYQSASPVASLEVGCVLGGRYRILRLLGRGGMAEVYAATDLELGVDVALKRVNPVLVESATVAQQFRREIALARQVTHRNVCRIHDFSYLPGSPPELILTMQYLDGQTLHDRIRSSGPLPVDVSLHYLEQILNGLEAAHHAGIIHRDLKPSNILLTPNAAEYGRAVILDFGLALSSQAVIAGRGKIPIGGTPAYMSPEQRRGDALAPSADIFALGVVMHEMLTGRAPSPRCTLTNLLSDAELKPEPTEPVAPVIAGRKIPRKWARCILKCMEPDPANRPQTVAEIRLALWEEQFSRRVFWT